MGMVAPWRRQEQQLSGRADQCLIHWAMESLFQHLTQDFDTWKGLKIEHNFDLN